MDSLNKQQVILVALLASFVTSIATGIVTATLLEQAPPAVTQTINRVVERTIEQVVQVPEKSQTAATVVTKETIVIKEDEQIIHVVEKNQPVLVSFISQASSAEAEPWVVAMGFIVDVDGLIAVYKPLVNPDASYAVKLLDGNVYPVKLVYDHGVENILLYEIVSEEPVVLSRASLADSNSVKLGQSVVLLGGKDNVIVVEGIVSSVVRNDVPFPSATTTKNEEIVSELFINFSGKSNVPGLILTMSGDTVGFKTDSAEGAKIIMSNAVSEATRVYAMSIREPVEEEQR